MHTTISLLQPRRGSGDDRLLLLPIGDTVVVGVADGAGGQPGGATAATLALSALASADWREPPIRVLEGIDDVVSGHLGASETTIVYVVVAGGHVLGASVGDTEAWLIDADSCSVLTDKQRRKPLLGSGRARAVEFGPMPFVGRLLVATDGLFKYLDRATICHVVGAAAFVDVPTRLYSALSRVTVVPPDDVAIVLVG